MDLMLSFGKKLWATMKSALGADDGCPSVSISVPLPIRTRTSRPMKSRSRWEYIVLHHSFTRDEATTRDWDSIVKYHVEVNGWKTVGYHAGVEMHDGKIEILSGRPLTMDGAHAIGFNRNGLGVCLIGNYDTTPPDEMRLSALADLCREWQTRFNIPCENVIGHRETYVLRGVKVEKSCPGLKFDLKAFRESLTDWKGKK